MKASEYIKGEMAAIEHCPSRKICPIGMLCGMVNSEDQTPLIPMILEVAQGEMLWTDLRFERRVLVVQAGVLSCIAHVDLDQEVRFALYGSGIGVGLTDVYASRETAGAYHLRAIVPARVCSLPARPLRYRLDAVPGAYLRKILISVLYNQANGALIQSIITSKPLIYDRIALLLVCLNELSARGGQRLSTLGLTHDEISTIVMSDRVSTTRALHKMERDGLVELGYRSIRLKDELSESVGNSADVCSMFCNVDNL